MTTPSSPMAPILGMTTHYQENVVFLSYGHIDDCFIAMSYDDPAGELADKIAMSEHGDLDAYDKADLTLNICVMTQDFDDADRFRNDIGLYRATQMIGQGMQMLDFDPTTQKHVIVNLNASDSDMAFTQHATARAIKNTL